MKSSTFFCEACSKPVPRRAEKCPHCGRLFDSVKCPQCSFAGRPELFSNGCPSCGYLQKGAARNKPVSFDEIEKGLVAPDTEGVAIEMRGDEEADRKSSRSRHLPRWAYSLLTVVLLALLIAIFVVYTRL